MGQVAALYRKERGAEVLREKVYKFREDASKGKNLEEAVAKEKLPVTKTGFSAGEQVAGHRDEPRLLQGGIHNEGRGYKPASRDTHRVLG